MIVELTRRQALDEDLVRTHPHEMIPDTPGRRLRIVRHTHRVQRTLNVLTRRYGTQGMEFVR